MLTAVNNCILYSNLKEAKTMKDMYENVAPKPIIAYFLAVFNVMLAALGFDGIEVSGEKQADVQKWMDALSGKEVEE